MPNYIYPRLSDNRRFEYLIKDLVKACYPDMSVDIFGRNGQKQHGIDILVQGNNDVIWCVQCKNVSTMIPADIDDILKKVTFYDVHFFKKLIIATSAPNDAKIVQHIVDIRCSKEYPYNIEFWPWEEICELIERFPKIYGKYYGVIPQNEQLKSECLRELTEHEIMMILRIDPLVEGVSIDIPVQIESCCINLQCLLDENLTVISGELYGLIFELKTYLDSYNGKLSCILYPDPVGYKRFIYQSPFSCTDKQYKEKSDLILQYRNHLYELIQKIASYSD